MPQPAQNDDRVMSLVELALAAPPEERRSRLESACGGERELFEEAWNCLQWELRMGSFLCDPLLRLRGAERPFEPGQLLEDRFRIVREVARGGMGVVYEARDEKLDRRIAIKCARAEFRKRLPPEARNATEISHPNVCKMFEIHTIRAAGEELEFLTMEFLDGETLAERLRRGPLPPSEARLVAAQLCAGLAEAHRRNVIHGDLKSGNVIVTSEPEGGVRAVITDFGLARGRNPAERSAFPSVAGGTPDYMAPELWKGGKPTVASDIYALGRILEELVSGGREGAQSQRAPPAPGRRWTRVVRRCLDPDPLRRFRGADDVARALAPRRRGILASLAVAGVLAAGSGVVTHRIATGPKMSIRLGVTPLTSDSATAGMGSALTRDAAIAISRLKGSPTTRFTTVALQPDGRRATHLLRGALQSDEAGILLNACVTDARTGVDIKCRTATYTAAEVRYAPGALAGLVTETFRLPAASESAAIAPAARADYAAGLAALRKNSGIQKGLELLERAVKADPDSPLTHAALAEAEWWMYSLSKDANWLDRAVESIRQTSLRNPDLAEVRRVSGLLLAEDGSYEQAALEYLRSIELDPSNGDAYRRLAVAYRANKQLDEALAAFRRAIEVDPANYRNHQALGAYYSERGDFSDAARHFLKAVELAPEESGPRFALGRTYVDMGRLDDADRELRAALSLGETGEALNALAFVLTLQGKDVQAIPLLLRALETSAGRFLWWMNLGAAYRRVHEPAQARRADMRALALAEREVEKNPRNGYARSCVGYLYAWLGQRRKAEFEIAQALRLSPHDSDARWLAVNAYEAMGKRDEALAALRSASPELLADVNRHPDFSALRRDPRFQQMIGSHSLR